MIEVKKLSPKRWKEYKNLRLESLRKDPTAFGSSYEEEIKLSEAEWKKRVKKTLFACYNGKTIGMIVYFFNKKEKIKHIANIFGFYVKEEYRNQGVGKKLIESALHFIMKNKAVVKISLNVNSKQKSALNLYKKYEFNIVGRLEKDLFVNG
ncbi:GNAT family N-acetyltransferase [Candidatus Woesearchaeota archaeon]|nr:GNAT family N-acetyltransferase [Candidatus Woesearchaeota archaeon]